MKARLLEMAITEAELAMLHLQSITSSSRAHRCILQEFAICRLKLLENCSVEAKEATVLHTRVIRSERAQHIL